MAKDSERLLRAIVSDYDVKGDGFFQKNSTVGYFTIPEGIYGNTSFLGWGNNQWATFEFGSGSQVGGTRQLVAVLRFKRDPSNASYGYALSSIELSPQKEISIANPSEALTVAAIDAARQYYIHACTSGTGAKVAAMDSLRDVLQKDFLAAQSGQQSPDPAPGQYSRTNLLKARYAQSASRPDRAQTRQFEEEVRRSLGFSQRSP